MRWARVAVIAAGLAIGIGASFSHLLPEAKPKPVDVVPGDILSGVSSADARLLRDFYAAMADIVVRDGLAVTPVCKTTFDLRNRHKQALEMAFANTGMAGKYAGLGDKIDQYLLRAIGNLDVPLTADNRQSASKAFASIK